MARIVDSDGTVRDVSPEDPSGTGSGIRADTDSVSGTGTGIGQTPPAPVPQPDGAPGGMGPLWALIVGGVVREITDADPAGRYHPSLHWQPCDGEVREGDLWTGGAFALPPPADSLLPRTLPALAFRRRFTPEERGAITLAASRALEQGDPLLQVWLDDLNSAGDVHLDAPELAEGLALLVARGLLTPERTADVLA